MAVDVVVNSKLLLHAYHCAEFLGFVFLAIFLRLLDEVVTMNCDIWVTAHETRTSGDACPRNPP